MSYVKTNARLGATFAAIVSTVFIVGCGGSPETADIQKQLVDAFQCGPFVVKNVKKVDGAEGKNKLYEVSYSFSAEIKGGKDGAVAQLAPTNASQLNRAMLECNNLELIGWLQGLQALYPDNRTKAQETVQISYGWELAGVGLMKKTESGWIFQEVAPHSIVKVIQSEPVKISRPVPVTPPPAATSAAAKTLTGILKVGNLDSCLETKAEAGEKCYAFVTDTADGKVILTQCRDGERCAVTAAFDDAKEQLSQVSAVQKIN